MQLPIYISAIKEETPGVKTFVLDRDIPYKAGQFLTLLFDHYGKEERRSFSISSNPSSGEPLQITIKRVTNGIYSRYMTDKVKVGDTFITTGAAGLFTLPERISGYRQIFLFAAGIGITPLFSILKETLMSLPQLKLVLIYSNRNREEVVFYDELVQLQEQYHERFRVEFLYSDSFELSRARLSKALIPRLLEEYSTAPKGEQLFYVCGPHDYMRMVIYGLEEQDIPSEQMKKENFDVSIPVVKQQPPDKEEHVVSISFGGEEKRIAVQYPQTILQAAQKQGVQLPYSCNAGRCGSCVAKCTEGKVWMSVNEVLTDADIANGLLLTCTGSPIGGDARIKL